MYAWPNEPFLHFSVNLTMFLSCICNIFHIDFKICSTFLFYMFFFAALQLKIHLRSPSWMSAVCLPPASSWIPHNSAHLGPAAVQFFDDIRNKRDNNIFINAWLDVLSSLSEVLILVCVDRKSLYEQSLFLLSRMLITWSCYYHSGCKSLAYIYGWELTPLSAPQINSNLN